MAETLTYRYANPSALSSGSARHLGLSTWNPHDELHTDSRVIADGWVVRPEVVAAGLLAVAGVAASRYYEPPQMVSRRIAAADPVVTYDGAWLRFESLSQCGSVHARLDMDEAGLDLAVGVAGSTNVDVNPPLASALALVTPAEAMRITVGSDQLAVETLDGVMVEKQVPLPDRWVRGLGESQVQMRGMVPCIDLRGQHVRSLANDLPRAGRQVVHVQASPRGFRLASRPGRSSVPLAGPDRLARMLPLLRLADRLVVFTERDAGGSAASAWELSMPAARLTLTMSAEPNRGFAGDGGLLASLAYADLLDADAALDGLSARPVSTVAEVATDAGLSTAQAARALDVLSASGRVGWDLGQRGSFHRDLPLGAASERLNPRLASSRALLDAAAVSIDGRRAKIQSGNHHHVVLLGPDGGIEGASCTCAWYARHVGARGPCKHVLAAAQVYRREATDV